MKRAYVFPGQGAQFSGMGKDLYQSSDKAREMMEKANDILGFRLTDVMFEGSDEQLRATNVTQPAIFLHSVCLALCSPELPKPDMVGGHSLGEFSALVACGAVSFEDALRLVAVRAAQMQLCCEAVPGTMAAVIGLSNEEVERVCREAEGIVIPANYNCDGQVVISGQKEAVARACVLMKSFVNRWANTSTRTSLKPRRVNTTVTVNTFLTGNVTSTCSNTNLCFAKKACQAAGLFILAMKKTQRCK